MRTPKHRQPTPGDYVSDSSAAITGPTESALSLPFRAPTARPRRNLICNGPRQSQGMRSAGYRSSRKALHRAQSCGWSPAASPPPKRRASSPRAAATSHAHGGRTMSPGNSEKPEGTSTTGRACCAGAIAATSRRHIDVGGTTNRACRGQAHLTRGDVRSDGEHAAWRSRAVLAADGGDGAGDENRVLTACSPPGTRRCSPRRSVRGPTWGCTRCRRAGG